jgi:hypothetical protein
MEICCSAVIELLQTDGCVSDLIDALRGWERVWKGQKDGGWKESISTKNKDDDQSDL